MILAAAISSGLFNRHHHLIHLEILTILAISANLRLLSYFIFARPQGFDARGRSEILR